jgi:hypothetical protein
MSPRRAKGELIEVYLWERGEGRPPFTFQGALEYLPPDAPLPQVGDLILLPSKVTGDSSEQTFAWGGTVAPFRVIEREHVYFRDPAAPFDRASPTAATYVRSMIGVRRVSEEEYAEDQGRR